MDIKATAIPDVKIITPARYGDHRGFFSEVYNRRALAEAGIDIAVRPGQPVLLGRARHAARPALPVAAGDPDQAPAGAARHRPRRRGRLPGRLADLRPARDGRADGGARRPDPLPQGLRPRHADARARQRDHLQGRRLLRPRPRPRRALGRPRSRDRLADPAAQLVLSAKDRALPWLRDLPTVFTYA